MNRQIRCISMVGAIMLACAITLIGISSSASGFPQRPMPHLGTQSAASAFSYYELRSQTNDKCLDVDGRGPGGAGADLANVQQYHCWGGVNQHWRLVYVGS
jgi:hypothetical protein